MNNRFPLLSVLSVIWRILGWLAVGAGVIACIAGLVGRTGHQSWSSEDLLTFALGVFMTFMGLGLVALGEFVGVFFAIEENTHKAAELCSATDRTEVTDAAVKGRAVQDRAVQAHSPEPIALVPVAAGSPLMMAADGNSRIGTPCSRCEGLSYETVKKNRWCLVHRFGVPSPNTTTCTRFRART